MPPFPIYGIGPPVPRPNPETTSCFMCETFGNNKKINSLKKEIEELKKRIIQLECEPYRGPEFFKALEEEKSSGWH